jgi:hypothetical protein
VRLFLNSGIFLFLENGGLNMEQVTGEQVTAQDLLS